MIPWSPSTVADTNNDRFFWTLLRLKTEESDEEEAVMETITFNLKVDSLIHLAVRFRFITFTGRGRCGWKWRRERWCIVKDENPPRFHLVRRFTPRFILLSREITLVYSTSIGMTINSIQSKGSLNAIFAFV